MRKANVVVPAIALLGLLGGGCGSDGSSAPSGPDVVTISIGGAAPATFSDDVADVSILAAWNVNDGINVDLYATGLTVWIRLDAPLPASLPAPVAGNLTCIVGGWTYTNPASFNVTRLDGAMGGIVEGTFPTTTLNGGGAGTLVVSGSFRATLIN